MFRRPKPARAIPAGYYFDCSRCHQPVLVEPNQSGSKLDCLCGVTNVVPSLIHLKRAVHPKPMQGARSSPATQHSQQPAYGASQPAPCCPFCSQPMQYGRIIGERYQLKWLSAEIPLTLGIWAVGGHRIGQGGFMQFNRPHVWGWRCANCAKIIVDERS